MSVIRLFLLLEGVSLAIASLIHSGRLVPGYEHPQARIAEGVIAIVLLAGLMLTWIRPQSVRVVGLVVQTCALLGTLVGAFTIAIGVGPRTVPDIVYHIALLITLGLGLAVTARVPQTQRTSKPRRTS